MKYYEMFHKYLRQGNGLYITDWASLDNTPLNPLMRSGGTGIDISAEMVLFARDLAAMARVIKKPADAVKYEAQAIELARLINSKMWNAKSKFYLDLTLDEKQIEIRSIVAFWPLPARVANRQQAKALADELNNPATFRRLHRVPTLAADEKKYDVLGDQWRGGVWAPTNTMVIKGLERNGYHRLAREIAFNHLDNVLAVFRKDGFIWENYSPEQQRGGNSSQTDFIGWSGIPPIMYLIEYAIDTKANAPKNELTWELTPGKKKGCERFRFNGHVVSLIAEPQGAGYEVNVESDGAFNLKIGKRIFAVKRGSQQFNIRLDAGLETGN